MPESKRLQHRQAAHFAWLFAASRYLGTVEETDDHILREANHAYIALKTVLLE